MQWLMCQVDPIQLLSQQEIPNLYLKTQSSFNWENKSQKNYNLGESMKQLLKKKIPGALT